MQDVYRKTLNVAGSLLIGFFVLSGCSSSSESADIASEVTTATEDPAASEAENSPVIDDAAGSLNPSTEESTNTPTATNDQASSEETEESAEPVVAEIPNAIPDTVRVKFDITVPAYQSNALQVRLVWGELDTNAMWVADESWTISENLQSNTEHLLVITFSDDNGNTILGSYEADFSVGTGSPITLRIIETDFDTSWDSDDDGMSNLAELQVGRNPFQNDTINNEELRSFFPSRDTMFGQAIENIPNPERFISDFLAVWEYDVINDQLVNNDRITPPSHTTVWERYQALTLLEHRTPINSIKFLAYTDDRDRNFVSTINPNPTPGGAIIEPQFSEPMSAQIFTNELNNVALPVSLSLRLMEVHGLVLESSQFIEWEREYDVPTYSLQPGNRVLWESWLRDYYWTFWETDVYIAWNGLRDDTEELREMFPGLFINNFAASGQSSDFVASFYWFKKLDAMPAMNTFDGDEKIIWLWNQPEFVNIRDYARAAF